MEANVFSYWLPIHLTKFNVQGFRMLVGNAARRRSDDLDPNSPEAKATSFRCFTGNSLGEGTPSYGPADSFDLPKTPCSGGIRSNIYFPR